MQILTSLLGIAGILGLAIILSENRRAIRLRTVAGAFLIQFGFGAFVLYVPAGQDILASVSNTVGNVMTYANEGISFLFGSLATGKAGFVFAISVLPAYHLLLLTGCCSLLPWHYAKSD